MTAPLVLLHAFPLHRGVWAAQDLALADVVEVITPDQRGFGARPLGDPGEPGLDVIAGDVAALLDELDLRQVVLGGLSMGGYVAMAFARRYPDRLAGLILADTKAGSDPEPAIANRLRMANAVEQAQTTEIIIDEMLPVLLGDTTRAQRPELAAEVSAMIRSASPEGVAWAQRAMAARPSSFDALSRIDVPALVIGGDEDVLAPPAEAIAIAAALPKSHLVTIPGAGHLSPLEAPDRFTAAIRTYLTKL